jgi:cell division protein FtsB
MAASVTLGSMKLQAREKADQVNSQFVSDAELTRYVNASAKKLYNMLVEAGEFYFISQDDIAITSNESTYPLADDFFKLLGIDIVLDAAGNAVTLLPFQFDQRNAYLFTPTWNVVGISNLRYMIQGPNVKFAPVPNGNQTVRVWYAPTFTNLVDDTDTFDGINGWEEYVILDVAIKMMGKEESDTNDLKVERQVYEEKVEALKQNRDIGAPSRVTDTSGRPPWEFWGFTNS